MSRCKPCANPYNTDDTPRHLPAVITDDIATPPILIDVAKTTGPQCVRGQGGPIVVLYGAHWDALFRPTWKRELDLQAFCRHILSYWVAGPAQHQPHTRQYQQRRINAARRKIARSKGEGHLPGSYRLITDDVYRARFLSAPLPIGPFTWYHSFDGSWWLRKVKQPPNDSGCYVIRFLDNPGSALIKLQESTYNIAHHVPCLVPPNSRALQPASRRLKWLTSPSSLPL